ncbi:uncharacterized protein LOC128389927 [Panonychus citri]|uniref:uncharacterized protein LOC128389927 n=1 Tax=Panonychus citri TaxID=50023 RepID=UPI002307FCA4|nr:uncharacterized protein LOC128389927 [Panonychus citri]
MNFHPNDIHQATNSANVSGSYEDEIRHLFRNFRPSPYVAPTNGLKTENPVKTESQVKPSQNRELNSNQKSMFYLYFNRDEFEQSLDLVDLINLSRRDNEPEWTEDEVFTIYSWTLIGTGFNKQLNSSENWKEKRANRDISAYYDRKWNQSQANQ